MSDSSRSNTDPSAAAERILAALGSAAAGLGARETLTELGDRARGVVEELSRHARARREAAAAAANSEASNASSKAGPTTTAAASVSDRFGEASASLPLHRRLDELRACVGEVADVLEATVERLETIEGQLGDPDAGAQKMLGEGIERCERVLMGIEHRVHRELASKARPRTEGSAAMRYQTVLVVADSSANRARLCLSLERQGLRTVAASGFAGACRVAGQAPAAVALLAIGGSRESRATFLEEWKDGEDRGILPPAAVLETTDGAMGFGFAIVREDHGEAALAASLVGLAQAGRDDDPARAGINEQEGKDEEDAQP